MMTTTCALLGGNYCPVGIGHEDQASELGQRAEVREYVVLVHGPAGNPRGVRIRQRSDSSLASSLRVLPGMSQIRVLADRF